MRKLKAKLRAWLIDLVREAIRIEFAAHRFEQEKFAFDNFPTYARRVPASKPVTATPIPTQEKSFEQFQDESIAEQATYYAPKEI